MLKQNPEHDPEKCEAVFPRDKRNAFARRSCSIKNLERDGDLTQSDRALRRAAAVGLALHELFGQMDQQPPGAGILQLAEGPQ
jgi:hypothetical protein